MSSLPLIVGFGGINSAGRSSNHHGYRRMVLDSLSQDEKEQSLLGLAVMMGLMSFCKDSSSWLDSHGKAFSSVTEAVEHISEDVIQGTLIRKISKQIFDVDHVPIKTKVKLSAEQAPYFELSKRRLPNQIPDDWDVEEIDNKTVRVVVKGDLDVLLDSSRESDVKSAGQLPEGFDLSKLYNARYHPKGVQMAVVAIADAINSLGVDWSDIADSVAPDDIAVYASSGLSQLDENSFAGVLQSRLKGDRVSSKQLALGFNSMPADFVNAYVCGSVGGTGSMTGACASFLYNLKLGAEDIRHGRKRIVIVGGSEAPVTSEVIDGFDAMGALARVSQLEKLDGHDDVDLSTTSRPFGDNCGFTIAESAQYVVLMDDELAIQLGMDVHGAVADVFVNADGYKKSISSPGVGNYITMSKAVASAIAIVGENAVKNSSFVHSHGSSTPQNRVTESELLNKVADAFDIKQWPVTSVKAYVGHSLGSASGDQIMSALGTLKYGVLPGIKTIKKVADDVLTDNLSFAVDDVDLAGKSEIAFLNSKGFGGNNASAVILSNEAAFKVLDGKYSDSQMTEYRQKLTKTQAQASNYDSAFVRGDFQTIYSFGEKVVDESKVTISKDELVIPGYTNSIDLKFKNPYN